jgi:hypothetical protein
MNSRKGTNPSEVLVTLIAAKAGSANLKVSYLAQSAGWYPVYDLRAEDINSPIEFSYRAKVYQSTGRDWEDVNLPCQQAIQLWADKFPICIRGL